jgi:uncharacterized protein
MLSRNFNPVALHRPPLSMRLPLWAYRWLHRRRMSRHGLKGSFLHSQLGDRLLDKTLWLPTRVSIARAWLIGIPVTTVPFLPGQTLIAGLLGFFGRANLLLCIALQFLSTPLTAPVHLPACYFVGRVVLGDSPVDVWAHISQNPHSVFSTEALFSLYLGSLILGPLVGLIGYGVVMLFWPDRHFPMRERHLLPRRAPKRPEQLPPDDIPVP